MDDRTFNQRAHELHLKYVEDTEAEWQTYVDALTHAREEYNGSTGDIMLAQDKFRSATDDAGNIYDLSVQGPRFAYEKGMKQLRYEYIKS